MPHRIETSYHWLVDYEKDITKVVIIYSIRGLAFTFDDLSENDDKEEAQRIANDGHIFSYEDLYKQSSYLILEEAHPCLFDMELENPEILPID